MNRPFIGIFGRCNVGKSSLLNFITQASTAIVSPQGGTTTDVVRKYYEIGGFAPVVFIDTAGIDDDSELGQQRVERTLETIYQIDLAILVFREWTEVEQSLKDRFKAESLPFITLHNTVEGVGYCGKMDDVFEVDIEGGSDGDRERLLGEVKRLLPHKSYAATSMLRGKIAAGEMVLLVCPIDSEAPAGRLILPQMQAIRELLDNHCLTMVVRLEQVEDVLKCNLLPTMVVTDSQVVREVEELVPQGIEVTTFSILLAAAKGDYEQYTKGLESVDRLKSGDRILIAENCSHQSSCDDIGRVKIPMWLEQYAKCDLRFTFISGLSPLPSDLGEYALMVQCGGCMVTRNQLQNRIRRAVGAGTSITNYGMLIRKIRGAK